MTAAIVNRIGKIAQPSGGRGRRIADATPASSLAMLVPTIVVSQ